jgi:hypothetical protein
MPLLYFAAVLTFRLGRPRLAVGGRVVPGVAGWLGGDLKPGAPCVEYEAAIFGARERSRTAGVECELPARIRVRNGHGRKSGDPIVGTLGP